MTIVCPIVACSIIKHLKSIDENTYFNKHLKDRDEQFMDIDPNFKNKPNFL